MKITVRETVRSWGYEWTVYDNGMTLEEVKLAIVEDEDYPDAVTVESVTPNMVADWLSDNAEPSDTDFEVQEITDRDDVTAYET